MAVLTDVLVVNAGSTSLKLSILDDEDRARTIASLEDGRGIPAVGHRIVHGGEQSEPRIVDDPLAAELESLVDDVIAENPQQVADYRGGKEGLLGFFVGQVMRQTEGRANPKLVNELLREKLSG